MGNRLVVARGQRWWGWENGEKRCVWLYKGCMRDPYDGSAPLPHCISDNILVVMLIIYNMYIILYIYIVIFYYCFAHLLAWVNSSWNFPV